MEKNKWATIWKGFTVGATMIVPGVSGGTMAMILGIYDSLISAVSSFRKNPRDNFLFLSVFAISAGTGLFLFSSPLSWLLENYKMPTTYFFIGAVVGGIPIIEKKSGIQKIDRNVLFYLLTGALLVALISRTPQNLFENMQIAGTFSVLFLVLAGVVSAAALILPGISFSHFLLVLGLYERLLNAVKALDIFFLIPLAAGILLGILLFSKMLEQAMEKYPKATYILILGFIIGSVASIFPGFPRGISLIWCVAAAIAGFLLIHKDTQ